MFAHEDDESALKTSRGQREVGFGCCGSRIVNNRTITRLQPTGLLYTCVDGFTPLAVIRLRLWPCEQTRKLMSMDAWLIPAVFN
jgi:hypothetical protein